MLSNVVRIIQKTALTKTLSFCLTALVLWFYFPTSVPSTPLPWANFQKCIFEKDACGKYLSYATPGDYVACLGTEVFKFPWRVIFGGFLAEDEQEPKLVSAHPQIPL